MLFQTVIICFLHLSRWEGAILPKAYFIQQQRETKIKTENRCGQAVRRYAGQQRDNGVV